MRKQITSWIVFVTLLFLLSACAANSHANQKKVKLYFSDSQSESLVAEIRYADRKDLTDTVTAVKSVMKLLLAGPQGEGHQAVIPAGVRLLGASLDPEDNSIINIDLSDNYYSIGDKKDAEATELLARYSIVSTLCEFDNIKKVKLYVDGRDLKSNNGYGEALMPIAGSSIIINSPSSVETQTEKFVTLYFTDKNGQYLYPETRKATMSDNSLEKTVVSEIIKGPVSDGLVKTLPVDTEIISVETTEGVCFVNFSSVFLSKLEGGSKAEKLAIYSVVNALTRLDDIDKVQILIDGTKAETDVQQLFSTPLEQDESLIKNFNGA